MGNNRSLNSEFLAIKLPKSVKYGLVSIALGLFGIGAQGYSMVALPHPHPEEGLFNKTEQVGFASSALSYGAHKLADRARAEERKNGQDDDYRHDNV